MGVKEVAVISPNAEFIEKQTALFNQDQSDAEQAIRDLVQQWPENKSLSSTLAKVCLINTIYGTNVLAAFKMAKHIQGLKINSMLQSGNPELVPLIAKLEIVPGKVRNFYSFATKYCNWHQPDKFPIYDSIVETVLWDFNKHFGFENDFKKADFRHYPKFKALVDDFRRCFGLEMYTYKQIDMALWQYGKVIIPEGRI